MALKIKIDPSFQFIDNHSSSKSDPPGLLDQHDTVMVKIQDAQGKWYRKGMTVQEFLANPEGLKFEKDLEKSEQRLALLKKITRLPTVLEAGEFPVIDYPVTDYKDERTYSKLIENFDPYRGWGVESGGFSGFGSPDHWGVKLNFREPPFYEKIPESVCPQEKSESSFKWTDTSVLSVGLFLVAPFYGIGGAILGGHGLHRILVADEEEPTPISQCNARHPVDGYGP